MTTVQAVGVLADVGRAVRDLEVAGVPSPRADAELLAAHVLGVGRGALATASWSAQQAAGFAALVRQRADRVPLQHLTGVAPFRRIELAVGPGVFIPRPETESVVEAALQRIDGPTVVDLCSGSGAIALAIASERPATEVHAVEADPAAIGWLQRNVEALVDRLADGSQVLVHEAAVADCLAVLSGIVGGVDLVISNPPYIPEAAVPRDPEVAQYDPPVALYGGPDGMDVVGEVAGTAAELLRPGGQVVIEHGEQQAPQVQGVLRGAGFAEVESGRDLAGRFRWTAGRK